jgi:hypothetical protein
MLTPSEYFAVKRRMLLTADAAQFFMDELLESYPVVSEAMQKNKTDVRLLLADCDILRSAHGLELFPKEDLKHADVDAADSGTTVEPVPASANEDGSGEVRDHSAGPSVAVPARGPNRRRSKRPKPAGNRGRKKKDS